LTSLEWTAKEQVPLHMIGQTLGHYRILEKVGAGGMGVVYRAHDEQLERDVAVKVLPPGTLNNDAARKHFKKEALALAKLNHPNIETIYEFNTQDGTDFLVMEYVPGKTLADRLVSGTLPEKEAVTLGMQIAAAMEEAHNRGIVHRDLKPRNIALTDRGQAKVLDFGLARLLPQTSEGNSVTLTDTQAGAGTLPYMSPEQLQGEPVDARGDIYTAGAVLYEMIAGRRAFSEDLPSRLIDSILHQPPVPPRALNPRISPELERVILKCLDKDPARRFQTAKELLVDLRRLDGNHSADTTPPSRANSARTKVARFAPYAVAGLLILAVLLTGLNVGGLRDRLMFRPTPAKVGSLAVLPLENLSHDPEQEYFADGMTEALITDIAKIRTLRVISRTSVMRYKGTKKPLSQIARELKVDAIVEGSVQRSGNQVRIDAQLIDARNDRNLWTESYQSDLSDVLSLQGNVARAIAGEIRVQLTSEERAGLSSARTVKPDAYEAYLRGLYSLNKRTPSDLQNAIGSFQKAIDLDPTYALAYSGLAEGYTLLSVYGEIVPRAAMPKAKAAAHRALEIDNGLAEAHAVLADVEWSYDWDVSAADTSFQRALQINPSYATAHQWYALYLSNLGKNEQAIAQINRAQELDPRSLIIQANVGWCYYAAHRYDEAIEQLKKFIESEPNFWLVHSILGQVYLSKGNLPDAIRELELADSLSPHTMRNMALLGDAYALAGRRAEARKLLDELISLSKKRYIAPAYMAIPCIGLGQKDQAFDWLEKAYDDRSDWMVLLQTDPVFDPIRSDPRFRNLLHKVGVQP
jgi:serine/threonine protein kinase/Tfp pilus assembly protein PilF